MSKEIIFKHKFEHKKSQARHIWRQAWRAPRVSGTE